MNQRMRMMTDSMRIKFAVSFHWRPFKEGKHFDFCRRSPTATGEQLVNGEAYNYAIVNKENGVVESMGNQMWAILSNYNTMERHIGELLDGKTITELGTSGVEAFIHQLSGGAGGDDPEDQGGSSGHGYH